MHPTLRGGRPREPGGCRNVLARLQRLDVRRQVDSARLQLFEENRKRRRFGDVPPMGRLGTMGHPYVRLVFYTLLACILSL